MRYHSKSSDHKIKILYIDDEENNLNVFFATFRNDFEIFTADSPEQGREILKKVPEISVIISDNLMPKETGIEFFENVFVDYPLPERILVTAHPNMQILYDAINKGHVFCYLTKPFESELIKNHTLLAYDSYIKKRANRDLIIGLSKANKQLQGLVTELKKRKF